MEAGYTVKHYMQNNEIGDKYRCAEIINVNEGNKVLIIYWRDEPLGQTDDTVAVFKIKPKL